jgi:hypothetical protein
VIARPQEVSAYTEQISDGIMEGEKNVVRV